MVLKSAPLSPPKCQKHGIWGEEYNFSPKFDSTIVAFGGDARMGRGGKFYQNIYAQVLNLGLEMYYQPALLESKCWVLRKTPVRRLQKQA